MARLSPTVQMHTQSQNSSSVVRTEQGSKVREEYPDCYYDAAKAFAYLMV